jgi:hypothetical protein
MAWRLEDGTGLHIEQETNYPWDGEVRISVAPEKPHDFAVYVRIPGWSLDNAVAVNGKPVTGLESGAYLPIRRRWSAGDTIHLRFDMKTQLVKANPAVVEDRGRVALQRGPIVFCMELLDQPEAVQQSGLSNCVADVSAATEARFVPDLLEGVMVLEHQGSVSRSSAGLSLYNAAHESRPQEETRTTFKLIPYYAWANRSPSAMQVWIPYTRV